MAQDGAVTVAYCHTGASPKRNGRILIEKYQGGDTLLRIVEMGSIGSLWPDPEDTLRHNRGDNSPTRLTGGTKAFFGAFWGPGCEYLYAWTPDGWLASPGHRTNKALNDSWRREDSGHRPDWPSWQEELRRMQEPAPLEWLLTAHDGPSREAPYPENPEQTAEALRLAHNGFQ